MQFEDRHDYDPIRKLWVSKEKARALAVNQDVGFAAGGDPIAGLLASDYDRTNDNQLRTTNWTGATNTNQFLVSVWVNFEGSDGLEIKLLTSNGFKYNLEKTTGNGIQMSVLDSTSTALIRISSTSTFIASDGWLHMLMSGQTDASGKGHLVINGTDETNLDVDVSGTIDWTDPSHAIGSTAAESERMDGLMSEIYINPDIYLDVTIESNLRKFYKANGKPQFLGSAGQKPSGIAPKVYGPDGDLTVNKGTGGVYVTTGDIDPPVPGPGA